MKKIDFKQLDIKKIRPILAGVVVLALVCIFAFKDSVKNDANSSFYDDVSETIIAKDDDDVAARLAERHARNSDAVGWLHMPACEISNIVWQGTNNDQYLRLDDEGYFNVWGCYFLDYINGITEDDRLISKVNIIYGHSLDDNPESEKFSKLKRYKDKEFAVKNPTITFYIGENKVEAQIFSACDIPVSIDYIDPNPDDEKWAATLKHMLDNSYVDFGVKPGEEDQILILSTCTSDENVRFVVRAKFRPIPEKPAQTAESGAQSGAQSGSRNSKARNSKAVPSASAQKA